VAGPPGRRRRAAPPGRRPRGCPARLLAVPAALPGAAGAGKRVPLGRGLLRPGQPADRRHPVEGLAVPRRRAGPGGRT
jgi:hypothetical protein